MPVHYSKSPITINDMLIPFLLGFIKLPSISQFEEKAQIFVLFLNETTLTSQVVCNMTG